MPMLIAAAITFALPLVTAGTALLIGHAVVMASTLIYGAVQQRRAKQKAAAQAQANLQDRTAMVVSSDSPWRVIYGEAVVGAICTPAMLTSGDKDQYKHLVLVWAAHECHSIEDVLINGVSIGALDGSGNVTGGRWFKGSTASASETVTFNGSGAATLAHAPAAVQAVSQQASATDTDGRVVLTDSTLPIGGLAIAGNVITLAGLAGLTATVSYTYAAASSALVRVQHHLGSPSQTADATLLAECPADWSSSDRLRGLCHSVVRLDLREPEFQGGPPRITARVRGMKVYDQRKDSTNGGSGAHRLNDPSTWEWTDNAAQCTAHFLTAEFGKRALAAQVGWASATAAANASDEVLPNGQKRYTCNGAFTTDQDTDTTLNQLCQAMAGFAVYNGTWSLQAGVYTAPVMALTDADNAGSVEVLGGPSGQEVFNGMRGRFYDPERFDQATDYTPYLNAAFVAEDSEPLWGDLPLPFTNADWRATNIARIQVERSRGMQLVYPAKNRARALRAGQRVTLTNAVLGLSADVFRVVKKEQAIGKPVMLTLAQDDPSMYDEADAPASLDSPSSFASDPFVVEDVSGLAVLSDITVAQWNVDGTVIGNTWVSWDAATDALVLERGAMQVEYRPAETLDWTRAPEAPGSSTGLLLPRLPERRLFLVRARWRNSLGVPGAWAFAWVLTEQLPAPRTGASLIDATWWRPGATWEWPEYVGANASNAIVWAIGPKDLQQAMWQATAVAAGGVNGGWEIGSLAGYGKNAFVVDVRNTCRFALPAYMPLGDSGNWEFGPSFGGVVCTLNTATGEADPRFWAGAVTSGMKGRMCLIVGYVFPAGSTGLTNAGAGVYDMETGALLAAGNNFCWAAAATECGQRAFFTGAGAAGDLVRFGQPSVEVFNGADIGRITYIGEAQVDTPNVAQSAITEGTQLISATANGSTGSPGASVTVILMVGPTLDVGDDEIDFDVSGVADIEFWSQAAIGRVEVFLKWQAGFGNPYTEIGTRCKFATPVDVYTNNTKVSMDKQEAAFVPGPGSKDYFLECRITWIDAAGSTKQCGKAFTADALWKWVRRKR